MKIFTNFRTMNTEQKAKAYDEALERMKSWARGEHPECFTEAQKTAEFIFPELCESKDERIRKELIEFVKSRGGFKQEYIAWLEKQGSQNNTEDEDLLYRFCFYSYKDESNILYLSGLYVNGECRNKGIGTKILEVADEVAKNLNCYAIRLKTEIGSNAERLYRRNGYNTFKREGNNVWLEKQGEQKSAWSREDEKIRQTIINEFKQCSEWYCSNGLTKEDCINWLNKQEYFEWGDEDNENMNSLCVLLDQMVSINAIGNEHSIEYKNWLKSIKQRMGG